MSERVVYELVGFIAGLLLGSFLNVCISRLPQHESIVSPSSRCPRCKAPIRWYDNIPLLSWLLLRGHCRDCGARISWRYPAVELLTALWLTIQAARLHTMLHFYRSDLTLAGMGTAPYAIFTNITVSLAGVLLIGLVFMDWETGLLPDSFTWSGIFIGLLLICVQAIFLQPGEGQVLVPENAPKLASAGETQLTGNVFMTGPEAMILGRILAVCAAVLLLFLLGKAYKAMRHRDGMGAGDIKLLAMITAFLGFWPGMLSLFLGVIGAAVYGVYLISRRRADGSSKIAFGSFLGVGGLIAAQAGDRILDAYFRLFR